MFANAALPSMMVFLVVFALITLGGFWLLLRVTSDQRKAQERLRVLRQQAGQTPAPAKP